MKPFLRLAAFFVFLSLLRSASGQVVISEFMADNKHTLADEDGQYPDWIELYNPTDQDIPLEGWQKVVDVNLTGMFLCAREVAPAMPVVMQKGKVFISLFALAVNSEFHYPKYFSSLPSGQTPKTTFTEGLFQAAVAQNPKPQTVALVAADA